MMIKTGLIALAAVFMALPLKREKGEFSMLVIIAAGLVIFVFVLARIKGITEFMTELGSGLSVEKTYIAALLKMLGIAYIADYVAALCREAGFPSLGCQVELFARLSIIALGVSPLRYLLETIEEFL